MFKISLEAARVNAKLTQKAAAKELGVSNKTLGSWERGETYPSAEKIDAICHLYSAPYDVINFLPSNSL